MKQKNLSTHKDKQKQHILYFGFSEAYLSTNVDSTNNTQ